jgi:hypothetical protein
MIRSYLLQIPQKFNKTPRKILNFCNSPYPWCQDPPTTPKFQKKPKNTPEKIILPLKASRAHISRSRAPFSVILAPRFSEFLILSIHALILNNCLLACIYLYIVCFALGNSVSEPLFEEFHEQVSKDPKVFFTGQQGKYP